MFLAEVNSLESLQTYLQTISSEEAAVLGAILGSIFTGVFTFALFFSIIILILDIIANWKLFTKMDVSTWKSLIPFYRDYILWGKVWNSGKYIVYTILTMIAYCLLPISMNISKSWDGLNAAEIDAMALEATKILVISMVLYVVVIVLVIIFLVMDVKFARRYAKAFNQGGLFAVLIFFFPTLMTFILGFGSFSYIGNQSDSFKKQ